MIDDPALERDVAAVFAETAPSRPPDHLLPVVLSAARRRRRRPRWLALIKERPMRVSSRVAVGSPTARLAAILAATFLLTVLAAGAVVAGATYLAGPGRLVVDPNDPDAYQTIAAAVDAAEDGDTILVRPGTYNESVTITKDITLRGDGPREEIVIEIAADGPTVPTEFGAKAFGLAFEDSDADVSALTVRATPGESDADPFQFTSIAIDGGAPRIHDVTSELGVWLTGGTVATISDSSFGGSVISRASGPITIVRNTVRRHIDVDPAPDQGQSIVRGNHAAGVNFLGPVLAEANVLRLTDLPDTGSNSEFVGIDVGGEGWIVRGNDLSGFVTAIDVRYGGSGAIEGNTLSDNVTGILLRAGEFHVLENDVHGGGTGINVLLGTVTLNGNNVEEADVGVMVGATARSILSDNVLCGNGVNLSIAEGADAVVEDGNEVCPDGLATASE
jgi:F-box protein 11